MTSVPGKFVSCFDPNRPVEKNINKYYKSLEDTFHQCFTKIRIRNKNKVHEDESKKKILILMRDQSKLKIELMSAQCNLAKTIIKQKLDELEESIAILVSDKNAEKVSSQISELNTSGGGFSQIGMWRVKNKLFPRPNDPPMAKRDPYGNIITAPSQLKSLYVETYKHRLRHRPIDANFKDIMELKTQLWELRLNNLKRKVTAPWKMSHLESVLKSLKTNQSRDPMGIISEIFKPGIIGSELKYSTLSLVNSVKASMYIPPNMQMSNITTIFKNKGSRLDMAMDRGIHLLTLTRKILDKMTYLDKYPHLDMYMSDSNIGARRKKNIRNHLFIIHGVINDVLQNKDKCIDIQIYDLVECFDSLWLEDCLNDLYDTLPESECDDKLALIYETNVNNSVAVNTAVGQTERFKVPRIVQQGGGWGPMECSNSVDMLGKICKTRGIHQYVYKNSAKILPLSMVDNLVGISECSNKSISLNTFINTHIEMKKLKFHTPDAAGKSKCHTMHIGKSRDLCPELRVHGTVMERVTSDTYLGDIISVDGSNSENIRNRVSKGNGIISKIKNYLESVSLGKHYFKIALLLRESLLINGIMTSAESWYGLKRCEIDLLEDLDHQLLRYIFEVPKSVPTCGLFLETGAVSIETRIKISRVNYLHYLVNLDKEEMLSKFFMAQWGNPSKKNEWAVEVQSNLKDFGIPEDFKYIKSMSENRFKNLVKKNARQYELKRLRNLQKSKMENLHYSKLELQEYLELKEMNASQAKAIFKFRVRMAPFGENFKGGLDTPPCPLCSSHLDTQAESFSCTKLKQLIDIKGEYSDVFGKYLSPEMIETLYNIFMFRNELRKLDEKK